MEWLHFTLRVHVCDFAICICMSLHYVEQRLEEIPPPPPPPSIQKQLERAMDSSIDVIHVKQQQEDFKFLSHFGGKFIIHQVWREKYHYH